jgi:hypothetical protein
VVRCLHIANGHATTTLIERSGLPGETSVWADVLHEGPVPGGITDEELRAVRAGHLAGSLAGAGYEDVLAGLSSWHSAVARSSGCDELVLWFEHDLFDQLNLIHLLDRIAAAPRKAPLVSLVCIGSFPGRSSFRGLGELTPPELASLFPTRQPVNGAQYALAAKAWTAFRSETPEAIVALLDEELNALPFLGPALVRHLEEFPSTVDGLSRTERRLLRLAADGPVDLGTVFPRMHDGETAFYIPDGCFLALARELAALTPPLLSHAMQTTSDGLAMLRGDADRVRLCGIDRWLGGVHLAGRGPVWRWNPGGPATGPAKGPAKAGHYVQIA